MHDATNPMAGAACEMVWSGPEVARMAQSTAAIRSVSTGTMRPPAIARISDAIAILRAKRDHYKSAGKADKANTVESCIQTLKEWAK